MGRSPRWPAAARPPAGPGREATAATAVRRSAPTYTTRPESHWTARATSTSRTRRTASSERWTPPLALSPRWRASSSPPVRPAIAATTAMAVRLPAELNGPQGIAADNNGNLNVVDEENSAIRKVTVATGVITTVAGVPQSFGY